LTTCRRRSSTAEIFRSPPSKFRKNCHPWSAPGGGAVCMAARTAPRTPTAVMENAQCMVCSRRRRACGGWAAGRAHERRAASAADRGTSASGKCLREGSDLGAAARRHGCARQGAPTGGPMASNLLSSTYNLHSPERVAPALRRPCTKDAHRCDGCTHAPLSHGQRVSQAPSASRRPALPRRGRLLQVRRHAPAPPRLPCASSCAFSWAT